MEDEMDILLIGVIVLLTFALGYLLGITLQDNKPPKHEIKMIEELVELLTYDGSIKHE